MLAFIFSENFNWYTCTSYSIQKGVVSEKPASPSCLKPSSAALFSGIPPRDIHFTYKHSHIQPFLLVFAFCTPEYFPHSSALLFFGKVVPSTVHRAMLFLFMTVLYPLWWICYNLFKQLASVWQLGSSQPFPTMTFLCIHNFSYRREIDLPNS